MARPLPDPAARAVPTPLPRAVPKKDATISSPAVPSVALRWSPAIAVEIQKVSGGKASNDALIALLEATPPDNGLSILFSLLQAEPQHNAAAIFSTPRVCDILFKLAQTPNTAALGLMVNTLTVESSHKHFLARSGPRALMSVVSLSPQPAAQDLALKALQNVLAMQAPESGGAFLTAEDLQLLVKVAAPAQLSGNAAARTALLCLNYLAANEQHRPPLRDAGLVAVLVRVIAAPSAGPLRAEALQALATMSRIELRAADLSNALFDAVFAAIDAPDTTLQAHACAVIANLAAWESPDALINACLQRPSAAPRLLRLCESASPAVHAPALLAASNLLSHESTHSFFLYAHCASLLLALVEGPPTARESALTALVNLSLFFEEGRMAILAAGGLATLNRVIRDPHSTLEVKDEALKALLNMSMSDDAEAAILTQGVINPLVGFMNTQTTPMQKELALLTLSNLSLSADGRLAIGAAGGMKAATQLLQTEQQQPEVQVQSAELLSRLALSGANRMAFRLEGGVAVAQAAAQKSKNEAVRQSVAAALHRLQLPAETEEEDVESIPQPEPKPPKKAPIKTETTSPPAPTSQRAPPATPPRALPNPNPNPNPPPNAAGVKPGAKAAPAPPTRMSRSVTSPELPTARSSAPGSTTPAAGTPKPTTRRKPISPNIIIPPDVAADLPPRPQPPPSTAAAAAPTPAPVFAPQAPSLTNPSPPAQPLPPLSTQALPTSPTRAVPRKSLPKPPAARTTIGHGPPQDAEVDLSLKRDAFALPEEPEVQKEHTGRFRPVLDFLKKLGSPAAAITRLRRRDGAPSSSSDPGKASASASPPRSPKRSATHYATVRGAPQPAHYATVRGASPTQAPPPRIRSSTGGSSAWSAATSPTRDAIEQPAQAPLGATTSSPSVYASLPPRPVIPLHKSAAPLVQPTPAVAPTTTPQPVHSTSLPVAASPVSAAPSAALPPRPKLTLPSDSTPASPSASLSASGSASASPRSAAASGSSSRITNRGGDSSSPRLAASAPATQGGSPRAALSNSSSSVTREGSPRSQISQIGAPASDNPKDPAVVHRKRTHIAQELLETEGTYCRNLTVIIKKFHGPLMQVAKSRKPFVTVEQVRAIFSNVEIIFSYHTLLLEALNGRMRRWSPRQRVGDVFLQLGEFLKVYTTYVNNYDVSVRTLHDALAASSRLAAFLANVTKHPACNKLDLPSFLIMPVQRVPRYSLLLRDLVKNTEKDHPDYESLCKALSQIDRVAVTLNVRKSESEHQSTITELARRLAGDAPLLKDLVHPARRFIREGDVKFQESVAGASKHYGILFLFNDAVLFADSPLTGRPRARALVHFSTVLGCSALEQRKLVIATTTSCIWKVTLATAEIRDTWAADVQEAWMAFKQNKSLQTLS